MRADVCVCVRVGCAGWSWAQGSLEISLSRSALAITLIPPARQEHSPLYPLTSRPRSMDLSIVTPAGYHTALSVLAFSTVNIYD